MSYSAASEAKINLRFDSNSEILEATKKSWQTLVQNIKDTTISEVAKSSFQNVTKYVISAKDSFIQLGSTVKDSVKNFAFKEAADGTSVFASTLTKLGTTLTEVGESAAKASTKLLGFSGKSLEATLQVAPIIAFGGGFNDLENAIATTSGVLGVFSSGALKVLTNIGMQTPGIVAVAQGLGKLGNAVDILTKQWNELYRGFETMQTLGVDTTFAELANSLGIAGEKILFNVQATKQLIATATQAYSKLEESTAYIRTLSAGSKYSIEDLNEKLQGLAKDGVGNAIKSGELAISVYNNLSAGIGTGVGKIGEALKVSETAAKYAAATGGSLNDIQKALNFTSQAFGRSAAESGKTMELLDKIVQQGVTNASELAANIGSVAATAASTGNSIQSTFAATALATRTLGSDAYTAIQRLYTSLSSMAPQSKKALDELGFTINAEVLKTKDLTTLMQELYNAAGGNTEKLQKIIPESIAFRGALSLMTTSVSDAQSVISDFGDVTGKAVDGMFDESQKTISKRSQALANGFQEVFASAGQKIVKSGFFDTGLKAVEGLLKYFQNLPEPIQNVLGAIVALNMGMEKAKGVIGGVVAVLTAVASTMTSLILYFRGGEFLKGLIKGFQSAGENANIFSKILNSVKGGLQEAIGLSVKLTDKGIKPKFDPDNEFVTKINKAKEAIGNFFKFGEEAKVNNFSNAIGNLKNAFKFNADKSSFSFIKDAITDTTKGITDIASKANNTLGKALEQSKYQATLGTKYYSELNPEISKYIGLNLKQLPIIQNVSSGFDKFKDSISNVISGSKNLITNISKFESLGKLKDSFKDITKNINDSFNSISSSISKLLTTDIKSINFKELFNNIKFDPKNLIDSFKQIPQQLQNNLKNIGNFGKEFTKALGNDIATIVPKIDISKFKTDALTGINNVISNIQNKFKDLNIPGLNNLTTNIQQILTKAFDIKLDNPFKDLDKSFNTLTEKANELKTKLLSALNITPKSPNFIDKLKDNFNSLIDNSKNVFSNIIKNLDGLKEKVISSKVFSGLITELNNVTNNLKNSFSNITSKLGESFKGINLNPLTENVGNSFKIVTANLDIAKSSVGSFTKSLVDSFAQTKIGSTLIPVLSGTMQTLTGTFALAGNAAKLMWTSVLAPALPIIALVTALGVIRDFIPAFGSVTEASNKFTESTYEIGKASKSAGKEMQDLMKKNKEIAGEASGQLDSFSAKAINIVGEVINGLEKLVSFILDKISFGLLKPFTKALDGLGDAAKKGLKGLANDVEANFDAKAVAQMNKEIGDTAIYVAKLKKEIKGFNQTNILPTEVLKQETAKAKKYYLEFAAEADKTIASLGNSEKDQAIKKQIESQVQATKESYEKIAKLTKESEDIISKARVEKRTLTAQELQKLDEGETEAFTSKKETIQQEIKLLQERYEEAKKIDAASAEGYKKQIDALNEQVTALDNTSKELKAKRKALNDFTNEINKNITDISEVGKGATKEFNQMTESLDKNAKTATGARKQALEDTSKQVKAFSNNITELEDYANKVKESQGKITNFQTQTLNSLVSNTKAIGLQLGDALKETFNKDEFQQRIQGWLESANTAMEEFQDPKLLKDTIKHIEETEVSYVDATGNVIKTTLDKTLTKEQLREFINLKLSVVDKELENKVKDFEDAKKSIQDSLDLGKIDNTTAIEETNKLNSQIRDIKLKASEDKLKIIEKEFGTESKEYKDHFRELKDLQVQSKKDLLKEQEDLLNARYEKQQAAFNKEKALADKALIDGATDTELKQQDDLAEKELQIKVNKLKEELELNKDNAAKKLEIEQQLLEATNELDKKKVDNRKAALDRELENKTNALEKQKTQLEQKDVKGTTDEDLHKVAELEQKELELKADNIRKQLANKQKGSKEAIELEKQLNATLISIEKARFDESQKLIDRKYEKQQDALSKEKLDAKKATRHGATSEDLNKLDELNIKELQLDVKKLQEKANLYRKGSKERLAIEKELAIKLDQLDEQRVNLEKNRRKRALDDKLAKIDVENVEAEKALYAGTKTREQFEDIQNKNAQKQSLEKQKYLTEELKHLKKGSKEYVDTLKQLGNEQVVFAKTVIQEQVTALNRALESSKNSIQSNINELTKYSNNYDVLIKSLEIEKSIRESNANFIKESNNLDISAMELKSKTTGDIVEKAKIQYEIVKKQNVIKAQEIDNELANLEIQEKVNEANRAKEKIQQRINKLEIERNILTTKNQIEVARLNKESETSIQALQLQVDSLQEQGRMIDENAKLSDKQAEADENNIENQKKLITRKKELNKESANIDEALAKQQIEIAGYDKQLQQLNVKNKLIENSASLQTALNDRLTKAYERQANLLTNQKGALESLKSATEAQLQIAMQGAKTDKQKEQLQQQYNAVRLLILDKQQKADLVLLDMQQRQNKLALQRQEIENNIAKTKQTAAVLEAQIEEKKVLAKKDATEEEKALAALNVKAAQDQLAALNDQTALIQQQKQDQEYIDKLNKDKLLREQETATLQERSIIAASTKSTEDDKLVANDAYNSFSKNLDKLTKTAEKLNPKVEEPVVNTPNKQVKELKLDTKDLKINVPKIELKHDKIATIEKTKEPVLQPSKIEIVVNAKAEFNGSIDKSVMPDLKQAWNNQANNIATEIKRRLPSR